MASSHHPDLPAKPIRFFKIILCDIGSHTKLMIPRKFARIFEKDQIKRIYLNTPNGSVWSVDLEKHKDKIWLQNGWPESAKYYSICFGYLIVFEYKGDSKFKVLIFDQSTLEIDYPVTCNANLDVVKSTQVKTKEVDLNDTSPCEEIRPHKKTRPNSAHVEQCHSEQKLGNKKANVNRKSACKAEKNSALVLAKAFKSENPVFIVSVMPSHLNGTSGVNITYTFREVYKKWMNNVEVVLMVGGKTWPVYCRLNSIWKRCAFSNGWARFARDNSLKVGDACVFELINPARKLFKVTIFRATGAA